MTGEEKRFLDDPGNVRKLLNGFIAVCILVLAADLVDWIGAWTGIEVLHFKSSHHGFESRFGFYAVYGFIAITTLVLAAKGLRRLIMRKEEYYDD